MAKKNNLSRHLRTEFRQTNGKNSCWRKLYENDLRKEGPFELSRITMCAFSPKIPQDDEFLIKKNFTILYIGVHVGPASGKM